MKPETVVPEQSSGSVWVRYFKTMPIFFPLIGLFLLGLTGFEAWNYIGDHEVGYIYWLRPVVLLVYFLCWAGACLARKIPAIAFTVLTIVNVAFYLFGPDIMLKRALGDLLFVPIPVNLLFSFLLLFYFRKMR